MKSILKAISIVFILSGILTGCEKESPSQNQVNVDLNRIVYLMDKESPTPEEIEEYENLYQELNTEELIKVQELFLLSANEKYGGESGLSPEELAQEMEISLKVFKESAYKAEEMFGVSRNKLNQAQMRELLESMETKELNQKSGNCSPTLYPGNACQSLIYNASCISYRTASTPDKPYDCDFEFSFSGNRNYVCGTTLAAQSVILWYGNCGIIKRYDGNTHVLVGNVPIRAVFATPWFFKTRLKMI